MILSPLLQVIQPEDKKKIFQKHVWVLMSASLCVLCVPADYVKGFGGKFGVQTDRQDKSALGWDHQEKLQLHESQKGTGSDLVLILDLSKTYTDTGRCILLPVSGFADGMSIPK